MHHPSEHELQQLSPQWLFQMFFKESSLFLKDFLVNSYYQRINYEICKPPFKN